HERHHGGEHQRQQSRSDPAEHGCPVPGGVMLPSTALSAAWSRITWRDCPGPYDARETCRYLRTGLIEIESARRPAASQRSQPSLVIACSSSAVAAARSDSAPVRAAVCSSSETR